MKLLKIPKKMAIRIKRIIWYARNIINNSFPNTFVDKNLLVKHVDFIDGYNLDEVAVDTRTPARALSDYFWAKLPYKEIKEELGGIHILDIGCGHGKYVSRLKRYSQGLIDSYTGLDIKSSAKWDAIQDSCKNVSFVVINNEDDIHRYLETRNIIISQSCLEHIDNDISVFKSINHVASTKKRNILQIHLLPTKACCWLYLKHGHRQYTPRTLSKITRLFDPSVTYSILYGLGGKNCNRLHFRYITFPRIFGSRNRGIYDGNNHDYYNQLADCMNLDLININGYNYNNPSFYVLIIHSNYKKKIFIK